MTRPEICSRCGEEVRWGWRPGLRSPDSSTGFWMHQDPDADHMPVLGRMVTAEDLLSVDDELHKVRYKDPVIPFLPVPYTTAEFDRARMQKKVRERLDEEEEIEHPLEPIEVYSTPIERNDPRTPQGVRNMLNLAAKTGWEVARLTYSRGPYLGAKGGSLGVRDFVVLHVTLDDPRSRGVASWENGKFDRAYAQSLTGTIPMNATALKAWMKEVPHGADAAPDQDRLLEPEGRLIHGTL